MTIGILFPSSTMHPNVGFDLMAGLKTYLKDQQIDDKLQFISESVGIGGEEKEVYSKAEKLLMIDGVDLLLAYIDERVLVMLQPLLYASGKLAVIINPGANYPLNWVPQPNVIHLTLQHAFCCWLTAAIAATGENKKGLTATTFYDCGYLHAAATTKSFVKHGGEVEFNYVNKDIYKDGLNISPLANFLAENKDVTKALCIFDSLPASLLYVELNKSEPAKGIALFVSPMMLEQKALENIGNGFSFSIDGHLPWSAAVENEANKKFLDAYKQKNKKDPSIFSLLGWEAAMILAHVINNANEDLSDGGALATSIKGISFDSPRGALEIDADTHYSMAPIHHCYIKADSNEVVVKSSDHNKKEWADFVAEPTGGAISGWTNTYLCY